MIKEIRMVDLHSQYLRIKKEIDAAISEVIDSCEFINGPQVNLFQHNLENYLGVKHVIPCANGTDALQIALMSLNLKPGDEVITTDFSFIAVVEVIMLLGLKPVIVDVDPNTFQISADGINQAMTEKSKVIVPVHLFGQCANMERILQLADKNKLAVIEDTAQALGSTYQLTTNYKAFAGTMGDFGTTSFFPSKNLGCYGDGGAIFTNKDDLAQMSRSLTNHGMKVRYYYDHVGINSRLDTFQAAVLNAKLKYLDKYHLARQAAANYYDKAFESCSALWIPARDPKSSHIFHQYTLVTSGVNRDELKIHLHSKGIPSIVYYPVPLHLQNAYRNLGYREGDFPVAEHLCNSVISLPMHTELDEEQLNYITDSVLEFIE